MPDTQTSIVPTTNKPILAIDFDGVIHSYEKGWHGGGIYGHVTEGFWEWAEQAVGCFRLVVFSSRSATDEGRLTMETWLTDEFVKWCDRVDRVPALNLTFAVHKPPAFLTIDDRCIRFRGDWNAWELTPDAMVHFKPWMRQDA